MKGKLAIAGNQLLHGNIGNAITVLTSKSVTSQLIQPARYRGGNFFFGVNGSDKAFIWGNYNSSLVAYQSCPVVSSIINRKAQCSINGKTFIMDEKGKESNTTVAIALKSLIARPNKYQTSKQFKAQTKVYQEIYGYCPVLTVKPVGFESDYSKWRMWNIPPWMLTIMDSNDMWWQEDSKPFSLIRLTYMGQSIDLNHENVFFLKQNHISTTGYNSMMVTENVSSWLPDSKLLYVKDNISNLTDSLNARGAITRNRGPMWIMSNDSAGSAEAGEFPIDPQHRKDLQDDFMQYGIMGGQRKAIITDAKLKLQSAGFDVAQLRLLEGEIQDAKFISDGLGFPPYLLGLVDAKFDNQQIAERNLYTNSIIPDCESDDEQWSQLFGLDKLGLKISTDFSHLPALQENIAEQGRGRYYMDQALMNEFTMNIIPYNRWLELLGEDTVVGMQGKYYKDLLSEGWVFGPVSNAGLPSETTINNSSNN